MDQADVASTATNAVVLAEDFFRHESGKLVSLLVRLFGAEHVQLAEDVVQEALMRALKTWPYYGVPENPAAWITMTAKNLAVDAVRRDKIARRKQIDIFGSTHKWSAQVTETDSAELEHGIDDAMLRMMLICCHPSVPADAQPLLALKTLCGFGIAEIASAFLTSEAAVLKRLTRAKERLREADVPPELVLGERLDERLEGVSKTIYLLFNEGYKATSGDALCREDLCAEAIRLASLVVGHRIGDKPPMHALLALMLFNYARLGARVDAHGDLIRLKDQDRSKWDRGAIARGLEHLGRSAVHERVGSLHLQAAIAAVHCTAPSFESTDWVQILDLYDLLVAIDPSPGVALNRAVAAAQVHGPRAGIDAVASIPNREVLDRYYLQFAVLAEFELLLGNREAGAHNLRRASELTGSTAERSFLAKRLDECT